jgi:uncharacterized RDD family membrane protein YckC
MSSTDPAVAGDVVFAGFLRRWAALFLDSLILSSAFYLLFFIVMLVAGASMGGFSTMNSEDPPAWLVAAYAGMMALYYVMAGLYYSLMESSANQATIGKMALGIKVVDANGGRLSFAHALGRWASAALSYVTLYIGFFMAAFTERKQALHDLVAGTLVVDKWAYTDSPERQLRQLSGCLIAFLIGIGLMIAIAVLGILAAIAIPAYSDYTERAHVASALAAASDAKVLIAEAMLSNEGSCPENGSSGLLAPEAYAGPHVARIDIGRFEEGGCGLAIWLRERSGGEPTDSVVLEFDPASHTWTCTSNLPDRSLPSQCR